MSHKANAARTVGLPRAEAARFVARIIDECFRVENHLACRVEGVTFADLKYWRCVFRAADRAFDRIYPNLPFPDQPKGKR